MVVSPDIKLTRHVWHVSGQVSTTGFGLRDGKLLQASELAEAIAAEIIKSGKFVDFCRSLNGHFSVIVCSVGTTWMYAGNSWSFPLFYCSSGQSIVISDAPETLVQEMKGAAISREAAQYFLMFGVTPGPSTLIEKIKVIRPGESVTFDHSTGSISTQTYSFPDCSPEEVTATQLTNLLRDRFSVWSQIFRNRKVLLPLTGGWDSRLMACLLRESGHREVICATWGRPGNADGAAAAGIARKLGYRHLFIPYSTVITGDFPQERQFQDYAAYAGHLTSMPFLQDFFAVRELIKQKVIDKETWALPGHPGDFIRGAHHFDGLYTADPETVSRQLTMRFGTGLTFPSRVRKIIQNRIREELFDKTGTGSQNFDRWDYEERQSKLIGNSSAVYSFFGLQYAMPLFDKDVMNRMLSLPHTQRLQGRLYYETLNSGFFRKYGMESGPVQFTNENRIRQVMKNMFITLTPRWLKMWYYPVEDPIFYREITEKLREFHPEINFRHPLKPHLYNAYLTQWYAGWVQGRLKKKSQQEAL